MPVDALLVVFWVVAVVFVAVVGGSMAVALGGSRFGMGVWGTSWVGLGCLGGVLDRRWGWVVWEGSWTVVGARWAGRIVSSCKRHVSMSMAARRRVVPLAGLQTVSARFLRSS